MDIAGLSMAKSQADLMSKVSTAVLAKSLEDSKSMGANLEDMIDAAAMERSVNPAVGSNFDLSV